MKCITRTYSILFLFAVLNLAFQVPSFSQDASTDQQAERHRLWSAAKEARDNGDLKQAADLGEKSLLVEEAWKGKQHNEVISTNNWLADLYEHQREWGKAEPKRAAALVCCTLIYGTEDWRSTDARLALAYTHKLSSLTSNQHAALERVSSLVSEGNLRYRDGQFREAAGFELSASNIVKNVLGEEHPQYAIALNNLAILYESLDDYTKAEPLFTKCRYIQRKVLGEEHPSYASTLKNLAELYEKMGDYAKAEPLYIECKDIQKKVLGEEHPHYATTLYYLAGLYAKIGDFAKAKPLYIQCRDIEKRVLGGEHLHYASTLNSLAVLYTKMGDYANAVPLYIQCRDIQKKVLGEENPHYATTLNNLAISHKLMGDYTKAETLYVQCRDIRKKVIGEEHPDYATTLNSLAELHQSMGDYAKAEPLYIQCRGIQKRVLGEEHPEYAITLVNLANLYVSMGDYAKAASLYIQGRRIQKNVFGEVHPDYAITLNSLANLYVLLGDYTKAKPLYIQCREIQKEVLGEEHQEYATTLNNLARLHARMGDYAKAMPLYIQCEEIQKAVLGEEHKGYATTLNNLAAMYVKTGDYSKAAPLYIQCSDIQKKVLGEEHPHYAGTLNNLAGLYASTGDYAKAAALYIQCRDIQKKVLGEEHLHYATTLNNLARLYASTGDYAKAAPLYTQCRDIQKNVHGEEHPNYACALYNLAQLDVRMGDYVKAEPLAATALGIDRRSLQSAAIVLSERQQLAMSQNVRIVLDFYLSLSLNEGTSFRSKAAAEVLKWKGATLVRQRSMRQAAEEPKIQELFKGLQQVTRKLASLSRSTPESDLSKWKNEVNELTVRKERLESELSRDSAAFRAALEPISPARIQASVPKDAVLVDFLEFTHSRPSEEKKGRVNYTASLLAVIVKRDAELKLINLGPAESLGETIDKWRKSYGMSKDGQQASLAIREQVWEPLLPHIGDARTVLISTDGVLGRLPFGALPGKKPGSYLIEDHRLAMIPVPQLLPDLVAKHNVGGLDHELLLMAGVDYNASLQGSQIAEQPDNRIPGKPAFTFLRGATEEIAAIERIFSRRGELGPNDVATLQDDMATEARFREQAPTFKNLHLATHGFFAPASQTSALSTRSIQHRSNHRGMLASNDQQVIGFNPGLLSGLAFAGANNKPEPGEDDGILTAQEIAFLPLDGVETVVLSACETGLGEVAGGEGLLGIQRAFQVAGVRSTVASLWKVNDNATRILMTRFYKNLVVKKMTKLNALREAQLWMLNNPEDVFDEDNVAEMTDRGDFSLRKPSKNRNNPTGKQRLPPKYWAAFSLSGDWN